MSNTVGSSDAGPDEVRSGAVPGDTEKGEAVRAALHTVAAEIKDYLRANGAPPIWYHAIDIVHLAAGCKWDDTAGEGGWGEYDCETTEAVR